MAYTNWNVTGTACENLPSGTNVIASPTQQNQDQIDSVLNSIDMQLLNSQELAGIDIQSFASKGE